MLYLRALAIREKVLGPEHPNVATSLTELAWLYTDQGNYTQAEQLYQRALAVREKVLGPEHPEVVETRNGLAKLYYKEGKPADAESLYQKAGYAESASEEQRNGNAR
jgi:tetratricopeptide (TPR) repeat protein